MCITVAVKRLWVFLCPEFCLSEFVSPWWLHVVAWTFSKRLVLIRPQFKRYIFQGATVFILNSKQRFVHGSGVCQRALPQKHSTLLLLHCFASFAPFIFYQLWMFPVLLQEQDERGSDVFFSLCRFVGVLSSRLYISCCFCFCALHEACRILFLWRVWWCAARLLFS